MPNFNFPGQKGGMFCSQHKSEGMVDIKHKRCAQEGCNKRPSFNYTGEMRALFCGPHKLEGMVNVDQERRSCNRGEPSALLALFRAKYVRCLTFRHIQNCCFRLDVIQVRGDQIRPYAEAVVSSRHPSSQRACNRCLFELPCSCLGRLLLSHCVGCWHISPADLCSVELLLGCLQPSLRTDLCRTRSGSARGTLRKRWATL